MTMLILFSFSMFLISSFINWWMIICFLAGVTCCWMLECGFDLGVINFIVVDKLSFLLILLTLWITLLMVSGSYYVKLLKNKTNLFIGLILMMNVLLIMSFSSSNLLVFYILFEATLIPIFMLIFGWGYQPERVTASYYLLFYTLFASLPLLMALLYLQGKYFTLDYNLLSYLPISIKVFVFLAIITAFLVKLPVYFGHLWLPKAHVEAPMAGSMVLAGVLLKLGGYGLMRSIPLVMQTTVSFSSWLINLGLFGAVCASFICIRQTDLKSLIAYSSVAHMGLVIVGLFLLNWTSWFGCVVIMVAHGLCSSGLFYLVGILYNRLSTRSMILIRGCITSMPLMTLWWFLFCGANMAAPPTPNLAGEIMIFMSSMSFSFLVALVVGGVSFMGAAYNLFLFSSTQHGNQSIEVNSCAEANLREHLTLTLHFLPLIFMLGFLLSGYYRYSLNKNLDLWHLGYSDELSIMSTFMYNNISFFLVNGSMVTLFLGLFMNLKESSLFIEWSLGGGENNLTATFLFDQTSFMFLSVVMFISANVIYYSRSYMSEDPNADRFILLVFAFVVSMVIMIVSPNIISILLGWDGLGLVSYCLVIYYPTKKSSSAGMLTVLSNRVGDVCILLVIAWFSLIGDYNYMVWSFWSETLSSSVLCYLVMFAAMTKSAQIPFSAWLPAAMAAPTPVSALVHSSTLVTAGVYLLIRSSSMLSLNDKSFLLFIATMTMFMSGLVANYEYDLKKIIALSTLSQLGVMMFSIALGLYELAFFHLIIHALFKALLFLCAGAAIHGVGGSQDIRMYGSLVKEFPLIGVCLNYANLSLCGFPFLAGFYSKDIIIEMAAQGATNQMILIILFISVGLTVGYSVRLTYYTFVDYKNGLPSSFVCDQDPLTRNPVFMLCFFSILSGTALSWSSFQFPYSIVLPFSLKTLSLVFVFLGSVLSLAVSFSILPKKIRQSFLFNFVGILWFLPLISGQFLSKPSLVWGKSILKSNDQAWIEESLLHFTWSSVNKFSLKLSWLQSNELKLHMLMFVFLVFFILLALL